LLWWNGSNAFPIGTPLSSNIGPKCTIKMVFGRLMTYVFSSTYNLSLFGYNLNHRFNEWCQRTNSTQKFKLLGEVSIYDLYYSLTHPLKWKSFRLETYTDSHCLVLNFYQINRDCEIRTRNCLVIKALIPCQRTNSTQKLKLLGEVTRYDLYYFLTSGPHD
jgi:hypothetical protein